MNEIGKKDLQALYREFAAQAREDAREAAELRKKARGILKNQAIQRALNKRQGIVLAYGMSEVEFRLGDLEQFIQAIEKAENKFNNRVQGIPYSALLRASRAIDKQRAKKVRNATLFQRRGNIFFFQVTGNSRPFYQVQIRLEEWGNAILAREPVLASVRKMLAGRISFECPCGRHQYWYRYMASIGNYGLKPVETGFPKIRNKTLGGCCCKHVLKVLHELTTTRVQFILSKELERERDKKGFSNRPGTRMLSNEDLRLAQAKRMSRDAKKAFEKYEKEVEELKKKLTPRKGRKIRANKMIINGLKMIRDIVKGNPAANEQEMLKGFAKMHNFTLDEIHALIRDHNL